MTGSARVASTLTDATANAAAGTGSAAHDFLTLLWISLLLTVLGAVLAFDVRGVSTRAHQANTEFTPWGRKLKTSHGPPLGKLVGWAFLIPGACILAITLIGGIALLVKTA